MITNKIDDVLFPIKVLPLEAVDTRAKYDAGNAVVAVKQGIVLYVTLNGMNIITNDALMRRAKEIIKTDIEWKYADMSNGNTLFYIYGITEHGISDKYGNHLQIGVEIINSYSQRRATAMNLCYYFPKADLWIKTEFALDLAVSTNPFYSLPYNDEVLANPSTIIEELPIRLRNKYRPVKHKYDFILMLAEICKVWEKTSFDIARNFQAKLTTTFAIKNERIAV